MGQLTASIEDGNMFYVEIRTRKTSVDFNYKE